MSRFIISFSVLTSLFSNCFFRFFFIRYYDDSFSSLTFSSSVTFIKKTLRNNITPTFEKNQGTIFKYKDYNLSCFSLFFVILEFFDFLFYFDRGAAKYQLKKLGHYERVQN